MGSRRSPAVPAAPAVCLGGWSLEAHSGHCVRGGNGKTFWYQTATSPPSSLHRAMTNPCDEIHKSWCSASPPSLRSNALYFRCRSRAS